MEIVKCWAISRGDSGDRWLNFFDSKEDAYDYIRGLARSDRQQVHTVFETFAGVDKEQGYIEIWSDDFPNLNSFGGLIRGKVISACDPELREVIG